MNKMTINHYIRATKKYREKTKIEKIRELLPKLHAGTLVKPEARPSYPVSHKRSPG